MKSESSLLEQREETSEENLVRVRRLRDGTLIDLSTGKPYESPVKTDWARLDAMTEEEIEANALSDPEWTEEDSANARRVPIAQQIRKKLGMTQVEFAETFDIPLGTLRDWERLPIVPDRAASNYLIVIERFPQEVIAALAAYRPGWAAAKEAKANEQKKLAS